MFLTHLGGPYFRGGGTPWGGVGHTCPKSRGGFTHPKTISGRGILMWFRAPLTFFSPPSVPARVPVASPERAAQLRAPGEGAAPAGRGGPGQTGGRVLHPPRPKSRQRPPENLRRPLETCPELGFHPKTHRGGDLGAQSSAPPGGAPAAAAGEGVWGREVRPSLTFWGGGSGVWEGTFFSRTTQKCFYFYLLKTFINF